MINSELLSKQNIYRARDSAASLRMWQRDLFLKKIDKSI